MQETYSGTFQVGDKRVSVVDAENGASTTARCTQCGNSLTVWFKTLIIAGIPITSAVLGCDTCESIYELASK